MSYQQNTPAYWVEKIHSLYHKERRSINVCRRYRCWSQIYHIYSVSHRTLNIMCALTSSWYSPASKRNMFRPKWTQNRLKTMDFILAVGDAALVAGSEGDVATAIAATASNLSGSSPDIMLWWGFLMFLVRIWWFVVEKWRFSIEILLKIVVYITKNAYAGSAIRPLKAVYITFSISQRSCLVMPPGSLPSHASQK